MLAPKKVKYRKMQKGRRKGMAWRGATLAFGDYGLQAIERGWLTAREIEAARVALTRYIKRGGRVWVRIFPDKPLTKKPAETRMGKGKGAPEVWVAGAVAAGDSCSVFAVCSDCAKTATFAATIKSDRAAMIFIIDPVEK